MMCLVVFCLVLTIPSIAFADTIFVPDDYAAIQGAIDACATGDTIVVRPGTYVENIDFVGKEISLLSEKGPFVTTIDGNRTGAVVTFQSYESPDTVIDGFTITNGFDITSGAGGGILCTYSNPEITRNRIVGNTAYTGSGIYCHEASPVIQGNRIAHNEVTQGYHGFGGGIYVGGFSSPTILENEITQNRNGFGGGIFCDTRRCPLIARNRISENHAVFHGGGIDIAGSDPEIRDNEIIGNTSTDYGGGVACYFGDPIFLNNFIADNQSGYGGAFYGEESTPFFGHNTITRNTSTLGAGGLELLGCPDVMVGNTIFWSNVGPNGHEIVLYSSATTDSDILVSNAIVEGGLAGIEVHGGSSFWIFMIIDADPLFAEPSAGDYHIQAGSPARDRGWTSLWGLPWEDFEGDPRVPAVNVDIGADEYHTHLYALGEVIPGDTIEVKVVGTPSAAPVRILAGTDVRVDPLPTIHGDFYLEGPVTVFNFGPIPSDGIFTHTATVPLAWVPGDAHPFQALVGTWGNPDTALSNLMVLSAE